MEETRLKSKTEGIVLRKWEVIGSEGRKVWAWDLNCDDHLIASGEAGWYGATEQQADLDLGLQLARYVRVGEWVEDYLTRMARDGIRDTARQLEEEFKEAYLKATREGKATFGSFICEEMTYRCSQCLAVVGKKYSSCPVCGQQLDKEANG